MVGDGLQLLVDGVVDASRPLRVAQAPAEIPRELLHGTNRMGPGAGDPPMEERDRLLAHGEVRLQNLDPAGADPLYSGPVDELRRGPPTGAP